MAALRDNGSELMRATRIGLLELREGDDPDLQLTYRIAFSYRSNGAIMRKRDHRFRDDPAGAWRLGAWKRGKKIKAEAWRKLDRRSWLTRQREILITAGYTIEAEASESELVSCDRRCEARQDQKRYSWR